MATGAEKLVLAPGGGLCRTFKLPATWRGVFSGEVGMAEPGV